MLTVTNLHFEQSLYIMTTVIIYQLTNGIQATSK